MERLYEADGYISDDDSHYKSGYDFKKEFKSFFKEYNNLPGLGERQVIGLKWLLTLNAVALKIMYNKEKEDLKFKVSPLSFFKDGEQKTTLSSILSTSIKSVRGDPQMVRCSMKVKKSNLSSLLKKVEGSVEALNEDMSTFYIKSFSRFKAYESYQVTNQKISTFSNGYIDKLIAIIEKIETNFILFDYDKYRKLGIRYAALKLEHEIDKVEKDTTKEIKSNFKLFFDSIVLLLYKNIFLEYKKVFLKLNRSIPKFLDQEKISFTSERISDYHENIRIINTYHSRRIAYFKYVDPKVYSMMLRFSIRTKFGKTENTFRTIERQEITEGYGRLDKVDIQGETYKGIIEVGTSGYAASNTAKILRMATSFFSCHHKTQFLCDFSYLIYSTETARFPAAFILADKLAGLKSMDKGKHADDDKDKNTNKRKYCFDKNENGESGRALFVPARKTFVATARQMQRIFMPYMPYPYFYPGPVTQSSDVFEKEGEAKTKLDKAMINLFTDAAQALEKIVNDNKKKKAKIEEIIDSDEDEFFYDEYKELEGKYKHS